MIVNDQDIDVTTNLDGPEFTYSLDQSSPMILSILRDKLYKNPIYSIVREISANAKDANTEAGKPEVPIEIWFPGDYFIVKDSGLGMSPDKVENVYCVYGKSTKRDSNDYQGFYGIGSKSVFSYKGSDHLLISTCYGGIKYDYLAYIDSTRFGKVKLISSEPTEEVGTTIKIPIIPADRYKFVEAINYYFQFWPIKPEFKGGKLTAAFKVVQEGADWLITNENIYAVNLLVDNVPYKQDFYPHDDFPANLIIRCRTGDVHPSATREDIQDNDFNVTALANKYAQVKLELEELFKTQSAISNNVFEVAKLRKELDLRGDFEWNNKKYGANDCVEVYTRSKFISRYRFAEAPSAKVIVDIPVTSYQRRKLKRISLHYVVLIPVEDWKHYYRTLPDGLPVLSKIKLPTCSRQQKVDGAKIKVRHYETGEWSTIDLSQKTLFVYDLLENRKMYETTNRYFDIKFVNKSDVKRLKSYKNWVFAKDYVTKRLNRLQLSNIELSTLYHNGTNESFFTEYAKLSNEIPEIKQLQQFFKTYNTCETTRAVIQIAGQMKLFQPVYTDSQIYSLKAKLLEEYPLLKNCYYADSEHVVNYVRAMKSFKKGNLNVPV